MPLQSVSQTEVRDEFSLIPASDPVEKESIMARAFYGISFGGNLALEQNALLEHNNLDAVQFLEKTHLLN